MKSSSIRSVHRISPVGWALPTIDLLVSKQFKMVGECPPYAGFLRAEDVEKENVR